MGTGFFLLFLLPFFNYLRGKTAIYKNLKSGSKLPSKGRVASRVQEHLFPDQLNLGDLNKGKELCISNVITP